MTAAFGPVEEMASKERPTKCSCFLSSHQYGTRYVFLARENSRSDLLELVCSLDLIEFGLLHR